MSKVNIFGKPYEPGSEAVKFNGNTVQVHEFMDEDYFQHITLPMREMDVPDNDDQVEVATYNRALNKRLIALALKPSLNASMEDIMDALSREPMKAVESLLKSTMRINGFLQTKNSPTTSSESA